MSKSLEKKLNRPEHANTVYANSVRKFSGSDTEERYKHNLARNLMELNATGFNNNSLRYRHNADGFRTDDFDSRESSIALGCSFTQGTGLPEELSWPALLSDKLNQYVWNLGVGGCSVDTCYRIIRYYISRLNVSNVFLLGPPEDRFEYYHCDEDCNGFKTFIPGQLFNGTRNHISGTFSKGWVMSDQFRENNYSKNVDAINNVCSSHNVSFYYIYSLDKNFVHDRKARDLLHPGTVYQQAAANMFYEKFSTK